MKIAHITTVHKANDNRIFYKECVTLANQGYDVTLIAAGATSAKLDGVTIVGYPRSQGRLKRIVKTSFVDLIKVCKNVQADIYHFHDPELMPAGVYLKIIGKKVIYDIHEHNPASILSKPYIKSQLLKKSISKIFDLFEKTTVRFFDALVTARPDITKRFQHPNIITLRNFPILANFEGLKQLKIEKKKPTVIFVGGMTKIRGIYELIDAFEELDEYELWLLGPITEKELELKIQNGCKNVKYLGIVDATEVFSYIQQADIGIITFLPVPNHINTLATKPFEYMACGKPMIMSDFKYWRETFAESSLYVDPSDAKAIASTVEKLLKDNELMRKMGELNKKLSIQEYNWEQESQKLLQLYRKLND